MNIWDLASLVGLTVIAAVPSRGRRVAAGRTPRPFVRGEAMASQLMGAVVALIVAGTALLWFFFNARGSAVWVARRGLAQEVTVAVGGGYTR